MNDLPTNILDVHGGLQRWKQRQRLPARIVTGGASDSIESCALRSACNPG